MTEEIQIVEVKTRKDIKKFLKFPNTLYKGNRFFTPECKRWDKMHRRVSPFTSLLALRGGEVVGRIAMQSPHFSRFDIIDDCAVARALLDTACNLARESGGIVASVEVLVKGFDRIGAHTNPYNYGYYKILLEECGFEKGKEYHDQTTGVKRRVYLKTLV
jgi:hypothetical protein